MKRVEKLAEEEWKATGWEDYARNFPIWHEAYVCAYKRALADAMMRFLELNAVNDPYRAGVFGRAYEVIRALADAEEADDASR